MPRKKREAKRRRYLLTADVQLASLSRDAWEDHWGGTAEGRRAWEELGGQLRTNPGTRPAPFWAYERGIPAALRVLADDLEPSGQLEAQALRWLLGPGAAHQRPGEGEVIVGELDRVDLDDPGGDPRRCIF